METRTLELALPDADCEHCADRLIASLGLVKGVETAAVDRAAARLTVTYDPSLVSLGRLDELARDLGAGIADRIRHDRLEVTGLDCADCAKTLERAVTGLPGMLHASVSFATSTLGVEYETERLNRQAIVAQVGELGYGVRDAAAVAKKTSFRLSGLDCADCAMTVQRAIDGLPGVTAAQVHFATGQLTVEHEASLSAEAVVHAVEAVGYHAVIANQKVEHTPFWANRRVQFTAASLAFCIPAIAAGLFGAPALASTALYALSIVVGGYPVVRSGLFGLIRARTLDMNVLMTLAVIGAVIIGEWTEGAAVVVLFSLGNALESYTMDRARGAVRALMALAPNEARVIRVGREVSVPVEAVKVGERIAIRPGERLPMDGVVVNGASSVNQAPITGESMPVEKRLGAEVFAGTINGAGYLEVEVSRLAAENTIARIVNLVTEAQAQKAPSQQFVDRFSRIYTPAVILAAGALAIVPSAVFAAPFEPWFYRALVLLVISCPCALVISTPVSIVAGLSRAASIGVLIKGGSFLEAMGRLKALAFDKTGTLSTGRPEVLAVVPLNGRTAGEVLALAAAVETRSEHPLAAAVLRQAGHAATHRAVADFAAIFGRGATAVVDGVPTYVGNEDLFRELGLALDEAVPHVVALQEQGQTALLVGTESRVVGVIGVADRVRPAARSTADRLRKDGIRRVVMLTGDHERTAAALARQVGVDEYRAGLLPDQKLAAVRELKQRYGAIGMVGDGVNDAPALAAATVGIAMGGAGTDVALETADVTLMGDDLTRVPDAIALSRAAVRTIQQNVAFAVGTKAIFLALAASGAATLWMAIVADVGASLLVTLNGMRLLRYQVTRLSSDHTHADDPTHSPPGCSTCDCGPVADSETGRSSPAVSRG